MTSLLLLAAISGDAILKHGGIALVILLVLLVVWLVISFYESGLGLIARIAKWILVFIAALVFINFLLSLIDKAFINW